MKKIILFIVSVCLTISITAQPTFTEQTVDSDFKGASNVYTIDIDKDGDMDVLATGYQTNGFAWWENDGAQNFTEHSLIGGGSGEKRIFAIDMDNDGDIDILGSSDVDDEIFLWENDGNQSFTQHSIDDNFVAVTGIYATDVDGDGLVDILASAYVDDEIAWWKNNGNLSFSKNTVDGNYDGAYDVHAMDMDNDGDIDILGVARQVDNISWWENDGAENFTKHTIDGFDDGFDIDAVDIDNDGDIDVLAAAVQTDSLVFWENDGSQNFTRHTISSSFDGAISVKTADVDGDGDIDVLGTAYYDDDIAWWSNDGAENFTMHTLKNDFDGANSAYAADMDGDGDIDIIGAANTSDDIFWWKNTLVNQTLDFDGTDDYVSLGDMDELENIAQMTAMGWFYFEGIANSIRLIANQGNISADIGWTIALGGSSTGESDDVKFAFNVNGSSKGDVYTDGLGLTTGKWYHIAIVFDGTQATVTDRVTIYINGKVQTNNYNGFDAPTSLPTTTSPLVLGAKSNGSTGYFQGKMDEISLWRTALSETTIHDMMHVMITDTTNLEAYYRFHTEAGTTTFADYSGKNHVATWSGSTGGTNTTSTLSTETYPFTYCRINNARAIWSTIGTDAALESDGFYASPTPALTGTYRHVYGHDDAGTGTTTDDLSSTDAVSRFSQTWKVDGTLALPTSVYFNLSTISGATVTTGTASDYVLLFRAGTTGDFLQFNTANAVNGDQVEFTGVYLSPGYYTLGTKDAANSPVLPVELLDFTGEKVNNNVLLEWQTATEINNSHFDVEWSTDGVDFIKVGEEQGAGTTNEVHPNSYRDYNFLHENPVNGNNYYRLKQHDFDGKYEYSKTINITMEQSNHPTINIFPNPATTFLQIETSQVGFMQVFNINGQLMLEQEVGIHEMIDISQIPNGMYFIKMRETVKKINIQR